MNYMVPILSDNLVKSNDKIESFNNLELMFQLIKPQKTELFDVGLIITLESHLQLINPRILPEDYYLIVIDRSKGPLLEIKEDSRRIRVDHLGQLPLATKIIVEAKLYQYVAYRSQRREIVLLADKFMHS